MAFMNVVESIPPQWKKRILGMSEMAPISPHGPCRSAKDFLEDPATQ